MMQREPGRPTTPKKSLIQIFKLLHAAQMRALRTFVSTSSLLILSRMLVFVDQVPLAAAHPQKNRVSGHLSWYTLITLEFE